MSDAIVEAIRQVVRSHPEIVDAATDYVAWIADVEARYAIERLSHVPDPEPSDECQAACESCGDATNRLITLMRARRVRWVAAAGTLIFDENPLDPDGRIDAVPIITDLLPEPCGMPATDPEIERLAKVFIEGDLRLQAQYIVESGRPLSLDSNSPACQLMKATHDRLSNTLLRRMIDAGVWWTPGGPWMVYLEVNLDRVDPKLDDYSLHYAPLLPGPNPRIERSGPSGSGDQA